jgi:hypothetical protein
VAGVPGTPWQVWTPGSGRTPIVIVTVSGAYAMSGAEIRPVAGNPLEQVRGALEADDRRPIGRPLPATISTPPGRCQAGDNPQVTLNIDISTPVRPLLATPAATCADQCVLVATLGADAYVVAPIRFSSP